MDCFLNLDKNDGGYFGKHREAIEIKKKNKKTQNNMIIIHHHSMQ